MCLDINNLYGQTMSQKLPVDSFQLKKNASKFNKKFIRNYDEDRDKRYIFELDVKYPKRLHNFHSILLFLPKRMKIKKFNKVVCNWFDKKNYAVHMRALKQALNHSLVLKRVHRVIKFNQKAWLIPNIDVNNKLKI